MSIDVKTIDTLLDERRTFPPSDEFRHRARVTDDSLYRAAEDDPEAFWAERRLLRDIAENRQLGDTTTLADAHIVSDLQERAKEEQDKEA